jgi:hypothetical protein
MSYIIQDIITKEVTTKFGPKPAFTIVANGDKYSFGFKKPAFSIGDEVDFQFTENTYGKQVDHTSVRMLKKGTGAPVAASSAPAKASYTPAAKVFPIPALHGDRAIVRQNSVTNATKLVTELAAKSKTEIDLVTLANTVVEIAKVFEAYSCGDDDAEAAEAMTAAE